MPAPLPPLCAAKFRPERLLGEGGSGAVWLATQTGLDRKVAIKLIRADLTEDGYGSAERFVAEAHLTARLAHPAIVTVIDHGVEDGVPWIAYEYVPGRSLADALVSGPMPWTAACSVAMEVASALDAAHRHDVVHRDVKAENVLYAGEHVKLADFGIAKWTAGQSVKTRTGVILGTATHLAPEMIRGEPAGPASDQYALGVMLYQMLTGAVPFRAESVPALLSAHLGQPPDPPSRRNDAVPRALDAVLARALAKQPDDRYPTVAALADALGEVLATSGGTPACPQPAPAPVRSAHGSGTRAMSRSLPGATAVVARPRPPRGLAPVAGITLAAALALAASRALVTPPRPSPPPSASAGAASARGQKALDDLAEWGARLSEIPHRNKGDRPPERDMRIAQRAVRALTETLEAAAGEPALGRALLDRHGVDFDEVLERGGDPGWSSDVMAALTELKGSADRVAAGGADLFTRWAARAAANRVHETLKRDLAMDVAPRTYAQLADDAGAMGAWSGTLPGVRWRAWAAYGAARLANRVPALRPASDREMSARAMDTVGACAEEAAAMVRPGMPAGDMRLAKRIESNATNLLSRVADERNREEWLPQLRALAPRVLRLRFTLQAAEGTPPYADDANTLSAARRFHITAPLPGGGTWPDAGTTPPR